MLEARSTFSSGRRWLDMFTWPSEFFVARLVGSFEFLRQRFSYTVVCKLLTFNLRLNSHRFHEGVNAVDPHSLSLIPHLRLRKLNHREVKWPTNFQFLRSVWQNGLQKLDWTYWSTSCKYCRLNTYSLLVKSALASIFCGIFFVRDVLDANVVYTKWKVFPAKRCRGVPGKLVIQNDASKKKTHYRYLGLWWLVVKEHFGLQQFFIFGRQCL